MSKIRMTNKKKLTIEEGIEKFIRKCRINNLTEKSVSSYEEKLRPFKEYLSTNNIELDEIDRDIMDEYIMWLRKNRNANDITINSYLRAARAFSYYGIEQGFVEPFKMNLIKATKKGKETYSEAEIAILLKKPNKNQCTFREYQIWAFESFLLGTGVRLSTALNIRNKDINFDTGFIFLDTTKNRKQSYIPLAKSLEKILQEYMDIRGGEPDDYLFCNTRGQKADIRTYQAAVQKYNTDRGVSKTGCHLWRHTYAKMAVMSGIDVFRLMRLMGHSDISVTKEYVELFSEDLATDYDRYNPLDLLSKKDNLIKMK